MDNQETNEIIKDISDKVADRVVKTLTNNFIAQKLLYGRQDLADLFGVNYYSSVLTDILKDPDFPVPLRMTSRSHPRWLRKDIEQWLEYRRAIGVKNAEIIRRASEQ